MKNNKFYISKQINKKNPDSGEHNEILENTGNVTKIPVTGKNVISFSSKEPSEANNCSIKVLCSKRQEENIVFSSLIDSSANEQNNESNLLITRYLALIERRDGLKKLLKWLERQKVPCIIKDISHYKSMLNDFKSDYKKLINRTKEVKSNTEDLNDNNDLNSDDSLGYSLTHRVKLKSNKDEKHQFYGHFQILKDKTKIDSNNLKIVFSKCDKNENVVCDANSKNYKPNSKPRSFENPEGPGKTELDKLHEYMCEMFDCDALLLVPSVKRRTNKKVSLAKTDIVFVNKSNVASVDEDLEVG